MSDSSPFATTVEPQGTSGFLARLFLMPFWPPLWRTAAHASTLEIVAPMLFVALLLNAAFGLVGTLSLGAEIRAAADTYDAQWDPIVWQDGEVRVEGTRLLHVSDGNTTFLVDPDETIPLESLGDGEFIVFRRHEWIRQRAFGFRQTQPLDGFVELLGPGPVRIDGAALHAWWAQWGLALQVGLVAFIATFGSAIDVTSSVGYALIAAAVVHALRGRATPYAALFRVALAASTSTIVLHALLRTAGAPLGCCGMVVWPILLIAATALAAPPSRA
jgi:hypothetical protein